jgi:hypothetical protein
MKGTTMSTFFGGRAEGVNLSLRRSPWLLRVVEDSKGQFDALDQLDDAPKPHEKIYVYKRVSEVMEGFIDGVDSRGRRTGSSFSSATYKYLGDDMQPDDGVMRDAARWQEWCQENGPKIWPNLVKKG